MQIRSPLRLCILLLLFFVKNSHSGFSPQSMIELKSAVDACLGDADEYNWVFCCPDISHRQLQEDTPSKKKDKQDSKKQEMKTTESPFSVRACKSGDLPLTVEKRKHNRLVTIISNVSGDTNLLLQELKQTLGSGGSYDPYAEQLEVQGDHTERISTFLVTRGCVKGVSKKVQIKYEEKKVEKTTKRPIEKKYQIDLSSLPTVKEVKSMKPPIIKLHLTAHGLSTQGNKKDLMDRLAAFVKKVVEEAANTSPDPLVEGMADVTLGT